MKTGLLGWSPVINGAASPLVEAALLGPALGGNELEIERRIEGRDVVGPGLIPARRK